MTSQHTQVDLLAVFVGLEGFSDTWRDKLISIFMVVKRFVFGAKRPVFGETERIAWSGRCTYQEWPVQNQTSN
jgi:hypothetical protein